MSEHNGNGSFEDGEEEFLISDEERKRRRKILDQRSGEALQKKWQQEDRGSREEIERKYAPPTINEPKCHVCQSPHRVWIEAKLLDGMSYTAIARSLPSDPTTGKEIEPRQVGKHSKKHMNLDDAVTRALMEDEADLLGQNWEEGVKGAFTMRGSLDVLIRKAFKDATTNVTTVEPRDLIQMIKLYNEMNTSTASTATEEAKTSIRIFMASIQNVLLKGDIIERELGERLIQAIAAEVEVLRGDEAIEAVIESHLLPSGS